MMSYCSKVGQLLLHEYVNILETVSKYFYSGSIFYFPFNFKIPHQQLNNIVSMKSMHT
jgi:hypothetical protein